MNEKEKTNWHNKHKNHFNSFTFLFFSMKIYTKCRIGQVKCLHLTQNGTKRHEIKKLNSS